MIPWHNVDNTDSNIINYKTVVLTRIVEKLPQKSTKITSTLSRNSPLFQPWKTIAIWQRKKEEKTPRTNFLWGWLTFVAVPKMVKPHNIPHNIYSNTVPTLGQNLLHLVFWNQFDEFATFVCIHLGWVLPVLPQILVGWGWDPWRQWIDSLRISNRRWICISMLGHGVCLTIGGLLF